MSSLCWAEGTTTIRRVVIFFNSNSGALVRQNVSVVGWLGWVPRQNELLFATAYMDEGWVETIFGPAHEL